MRGGVAKIEALAVEQHQEEAREREESLSQHLAASEHNLRQAMARAARARSLQDKCAPPPSVLS